MVASRFVRLPKRNPDFHPKQLMTRCQYWSTSYQKSASVFTVHYVSNHPGLWTGICRAIHLPWYEQTGITLGHSLTIDTVEDSLYDRPRELSWTSKSTKHPKIGDSWFHWNGPVLWRLYKGIAQFPCNVVLINRPWARQVCYRNFRSPSSTSQSLHDNTAQICIIREA